MEFNNQNEERKLITADEFLKLVTENGELRGYQIDEELVLEDSILPKTSYQLIFKNCYFKSIELKNIGAQVKLFFKNCTFNHFSCIDMNASIHLSTIKSFGEQSAFIIRTSDLNNASLFDVNLKSFDSVIIEKTDFTNMTTSRVTWFEDKKLKTSYEADYESAHERREFYRQLKYNQEKQGNKIQALTFQSLEMQYYSQELDPKNFIDSILLKNKFLAFFGHFILAFTSQNRFILWIGKSNNHGQSFLKPLLFLVVLGLIFNFLIIQSASPQSTMELLFKKGSLKMLPSLLNPVHDISRLLHMEEPSFWTSLLDLTWKVIETTLIFQTITAFRKHVRV